MPTPPTEVLKDEKRIIYDRTNQFEEECGFRDVLGKAREVLKAHVNSRAIINELFEDGFIHLENLSPIQNLPEGSRFEHMLDLISSTRDEYSRFKVYLARTDQYLLLWYLERLENGEEIKTDDQLMVDIQAETHRRVNSQPIGDERNDTDQTNDNEEESEQEHHKRVLDRCSSTIKESLIPDPIIDYFTEENFIPFIKIRNIKESKTTTEKNTSIVDEVRGKGVRGYDFFKQCLLKSGQNLLHKCLEKCEKGEDITPTRIELLEETKRLNRKKISETRNQVLNEESAVNSVEESVVMAISEGADLQGSEDIEEKVKIKGSTEISRNICCHTIKYIIEKASAGIYPERIIEAVNDIASMINVEVRKASVYEDSSVVITMTCFTYQEMRELLKILRGKSFQEGIVKLKDAIVQEYEDDFVVEAKPSPEKIREIKDRLRSQVNPENNNDANICKEHADKQHLNEYFCPEHDVFSCEKCATTKHRKCHGLRQITSDSNSRKEYRVRTDETQLCSTQGLVVLPSGEILLIDNVTYRLKKLNIYYKVDDQYILNKPPHDICVVDERRALICFGGNVRFVNVNESLVLGQEVNLKKSCFRLAWSQNTIYFTDNIALFRCDENGGNLEELVSFEKEEIICNRLVISYDGQKIFVAAGSKGLIKVDPIHKIMSCFASDKLKTCTDISLVGDNLLLVCDFEMQAIYAVDIEKDIIVKTVVQQSNGLKLPRSLDINEPDSLLVVGRLGTDFISVFEVEI